MPLTVTVIEYVCQRSEAERKVVMLTVCVGHSNKAPTAHLTLVSFSPQDRGIDVHLLARRLLPKPLGPAHCQCVSVIEANEQHTTHQDD